MAEILEVKASPGTYTVKREGDENIETRKRGAGAEKPSQRMLLAWEELASRPNILVCQDTEYSTASSGVRPLFVSSPPDQADVLFETPGADLPARLQVEQRYRSFRSKLIATLLDEPIEDGVTHPAEHLIDKALRIDSADCQNWLSQALVELYPTRPTLGASIVRCIGRLDYERVGEWGMHVVDDALRNRDVEVREAAIRALEAWGGRAALEMLRGHKDTKDWLNEYVQQVIVDLSGTTS